MAICEQCGNDGIDGDKFCRQCGEEFGADTLNCECGAEVGPDDNFCHACGAAFTEESDDDKSKGQ